MTVTADDKIDDGRDAERAPHRVIEERVEPARVGERGEARAADLGVEDRLGRAKK